jgi:hypothetical protein
MDPEIEKQHWTPETDGALADMRAEYANTLDESRRRELERMMDDRNREVHGVATRADIGLPE